ncbi:MAG TPA: protease modulator HflC [Candidatus Latescibacteria bacterium]|nr:protease modulator HflC [Candidatus Latescibacterota bacterium]
MRGSRSRRNAAIIIITIIALVILNSWLFTVDETEQVIIIQMGRYVRTIKEPGLHMKVPFIQKIHRYDDRVLQYDAAPARVLTKDKKHLIVDNYARWKIEDPLKFYQTVRNEIGAQSRIDDIVFSELRGELALHDLSAIISVQRERIMEKVAGKSDEKARQLGIRIIDVRIKRADLPEEVAHSVYERMRAERERIAKKYRSEGREESAKIEAQAEKEKTIILAEAYRKAQKIRGEGDAEAVRIYAAAFRKDPEFYSFVRSLEAYKKAIDSTTVIVLPPDMEFLKYLRGGGSRK